MTSVHSDADGDVVHAGRAAFKAPPDIQDEHHHLTTLDGWRRFVADAPATPALLPTPHGEDLQSADPHGDQARDSRT